MDAVLATVEKQVAMAKHNDDLQQERRIGNGAGTVGPDLPRDHLLVEETPGCRRSALLQH